MNRATRRTFVTSCSLGTVVSLAGCLGGEDALRTPTNDTPTNAETPTHSPSPDTMTPTRSPPTYECDSAARPEPDAPDREDTVEPISYPPISELLDGTDGVVEYERAYRRNSLVATEGQSLVGFGMSNVDATEHDSPDSSNVVRVEYTFYYETEDENGEVTITDSPTINASYYVDDAVVIRAEKRGPTDDGLDPDPLADGEVLECSK